MAYINGAKTLRHDAVVPRFDFSKASHNSLVLCQ